MNRILQFTLLFLFTMVFSGCSNVKSFLATGLQANTQAGSNPLKSKDDLKIENLIMSGTWNYQRQDSDCKDTAWQQRFHRSRYYQSMGSACLVPNSFSVEAESWHIKNQNLYIVNLTPKEEDDIVLKYAIEYIDKAKMIVSSNGYRYTFIKK